MKKLFYLIIVLSFLFIFFNPASAAKTLEACPYGINYGGGGRPDNNISCSDHQYLLGKVKESGVCWIRVWLLWLDVEKAPGQFNWSNYDCILDEAKKQNLKVVLTIDKTPRFYSVEPERSRFDLCPTDDIAAFERFVGQAVSRYQDKVSVWQIENESFSKSCFKNHPEGYSRMFNAAARIIREKAPQAKIATAGIAYSNSIKKYIHDWLGETKTNFDIVAIHAHRRLDGEVRGVIGNVRSIMANLGISGKPIFLTETSFNVKDYPNVDPYANFKSRITSVLKYSDKVFWFKHRTGPWGPGIVKKTSSSYSETPLFKTYKELITKAGWFFGSQAAPARPPALPSEKCNCFQARDYKGRGDANCDGRTNILDYNIWFDTFIRGRKNYGGMADFNCKGGVNVDDYQVWLRTAW